MIDLILSDPATLPGLPDSSSRPPDSKRDVLFCRWKNLACAIGVDVSRAAHALVIHERPAVEHGTRLLAAHSAWPADMPRKTGI